MKQKQFLSLALALIMIATTAFFAPAPVSMSAKAASVTTTQLDSSPLLDDLLATATSFIVIKQKQLGGSHYAYTEGLREESGEANSPEGTETNFRPGSQMVLVTLTKSGSKVTKTEEVLIDSPVGVVRDPDVSADGARVLFSWKKELNDDFHLYEMALGTREIRQLTKGSGIADFEPKYLPNGNIIFSSSRIQQTVDCWKTPVSNLFICGKDGENIVRVGYDQVHTTYPTVTEDGRVLYTRWDYNDRNQMFIQALFQMFPDGTNQTEVFGNDANFPTTLLHTRDIPGAAGKYISIASGHHVNQAGKLVMIDTSKGRNDPDAVTFVFPDAYSNKNSSVDLFGQQGPIYKYPYALNETEFLVSYSASGWASNQTDTAFSIYLMNTSGTKIELVTGTAALPASQIVPIKTRTMFERPSMVNYGSETGTYYIGNIYEGGGLEGIEAGEAKTLRVVALNYRSSAIGATVGSGTGTSDPFSPIATGNGAWDVKEVLGVVPIEADGSALFKVPARMPIYFQVLNADGDVIQSMRSWTTLMPNETFSCVGCHEDKNTVPPASSSTTIAMSKGVQELQPDVWQTGEGYEDYDPYTDYKGFSYLKEVQPILDESCIECHSNVAEAYSNINVSGMNGATSTVSSDIVAQRSEWSYTNSNPGTNWNKESYDDSKWKTGYAPFGSLGTSPGEVNTVWTDNFVWMRTEAFVTQSQLNDLNLFLDIAHTLSAVVYFNGTQVWQGNGGTGAYQRIPVTDTMRAALHTGKNVIALLVQKGPSGQYVDFGLKAEEKPTTTVNFIGKGASWKYKMSATNSPVSGWETLGFDDSAWSSAPAPFGDRSGWVTSWTGGNNYLWIRKTFTIDDLNALKNAALYLDIFYDDTPEIYLNGTKVFSDSKWVDNYTLIPLPDTAADLLKAGTNVLAIKIQNTTGGRQIDTAFYAKTRNIEEVTVLPTKEDGWKYVINQKPADNWYTESFNDTSWSTGKAGFGNIGGASTPWTGDNSDIWIRKTFTLDGVQQFLDKKLYLSIFYDEDPQVYLNGTLIYSATGYSTSYVTKPLDIDYTKLLKTGQNLIAVKAHNSSGGLYIDVGLTAREITTPVSLEGTNVVGSRQKKYFPLSYLVLTNSVPTGSVNWIGDSTGSMVNWISGMSQCEMLEPYSFGAATSKLMEKLRAGHGSLTETQIRKIAAWIDLGVPAYGAYDENVNWGNNERREFEEKQNKRALYDQMDYYARLARANGGKYIGAGNLKIEFTTAAGKGYETTDSGMAILEVDAKYSSGDKLRITLPEGEKYLMVSLSSRVGEALVYVPDGVYNYTLPDDLGKIFPKTMDPSSAISYINNTITARVATEKDLKTQRNLAENPYDVKSASSAYPHATTNSVFGNQAEFEVRNMIDGFTGNKGHQFYPNQSWGPDQTGDFWVNIDFGRTVRASQVQIIIRADFPHDTYYTDATLEFSDGTTKDIKLRKTTDPQIIDFDPIETTYVKIKNLKAAANNWAGLSEVKVMGTELISEEPSVIPGDVDGDEEVNASDVVALRRLIASGDEPTAEQLAAGDLNEDSLLTSADVTALLDQLDILPGDVDNNKQLAALDIMVMRKLMLSGGATDTHLAAGDLDGNGELGALDIMKLRKLMLES